MKRQERVSFLAPVTLNIFAHVLLFMSAQGMSQEPEFAEPIRNVTVAAGREATLSCIVNNLGTYKVAWIHLDRSTILTVQHHVITRNPRISITQSNHRAWYLNVRDVRATDNGTFMCQINTEPVKTQLGQLTVVVPPDIIDSETSSEVVTKEDSNVTLKCSARGNPKPSIMWRREDGKKFLVTKNKQVTKVDKELLEITRVSRLHMGAFLCIASNGIPPAVSKRVVLKVDFPPMLWIPHQLVGAPPGYEATLECQTEAHPKSINYWAGDDGLMIFPNEKYNINYTENGYTTGMRLRIRSLNKDDYGTYKCIAKNPLGETEGIIRLYETEAPSTVATTAVTQLYGRIDDYSRLKNDNFSGYRNPSSLVVHEGDQGPSFKQVKMKINRTDDAMPISPPRDWSRSHPAHNTAGEQYNMKSVLCVAWPVVTLLISRLVNYCAT